jgi:His-Xaa-Ser system radical SAM maturase HxsC
MIPLVLPARADGLKPYITRVADVVNGDERDCRVLSTDAHSLVLSGSAGLLEIGGMTYDEVRGDVLLIDPEAGRAERLIRAASPHNTLLVTERCDQLCVMCSQPPKKTHVDRFAYLEQACLLAPEGAVIGITGGEPTLYKEELFGLLDRVLQEREDLEFHVLSNAQHFTEADLPQLRKPAFRRVVWGIPLYSAFPEKHDSIVGKSGAFERLHQSLHVLLRAGTRVELRTVLVQQNAAELSQLARHIARHLRFIDVWSIMQLENIGFAKNRWSTLYVDHQSDFSEVAAAIDHIELHGMAVRLFNFPRCSVPAPYRDLATASISDWKKKFMPACESCTEREACTGFFEWHPDDHFSAKVTPL